MLWVDHGLDPRIVLDESMEPVVLAAVDRLVAKQKQQGEEDQLAEDAESFDRMHEQLKRS